jgi:hypothetical protein
MLRGSVVPDCVAYVSRVFASICRLTSGCLWLCRDDPVILAWDICNEPRCPNNITGKLAVMSPSTQLSLCMPRSRIAAPHFAAFLKCCPSFCRVPEVLPLILLRSRSAVPLSIDLLQIPKYWPGSTSTKSMANEHSIGLRLGNCRTGGSTDAPAHYNAHARGMSC